LCVLYKLLICFQTFFDSFRAESRSNLQILVVSASYMNTGFGSRALDASGKPVGREDDDQKKGYSPEYSARFALVAVLPVLIFSVVYSRLFTRRTLGRG